MTGELELTRKNASKRRKGCSIGETVGRIAVEEAEEMVELEEEEEEEIQRVAEAKKRRYLDLSIQLSVKGRIQRKSRKVFSVINHFTMMTMI